MSDLKPPVKANPWVDPHVAQTVREYVQRIGVSEFDAACIIVQRVRAALETAGLAGFVTPGAKA